MSRCNVCNRFGLRPCRRTRWCIGWARASAKLADLLFVATEVVYSKECGKYVVPAW